MSESLNYYKEIIKEKRKQTSFRDFLKEIVSWHPFILNKNSWLVSRFPKSSRVKICDKKEFEENRDDLVKSWINYDFEKDFLNNFEKLFKQIKLPNIFHYKANENSDFTDVAVDSKNTYLSNCVVLYSQNVLYSFMVRWECDTVLNSLFVSSNSQNIYFSRWIISSFNVFYSSYINNSNNIWFCSNLVWCCECISCNNLENQKYCINNKKLEKRDYLVKKQEILKQKNNFDKYFWKIETLWKNHWSSNSNWNYIINSDNVSNWYYTFGTKNAKNVMFIWADKQNDNFYDVFIAGGSGRYDNYAVQSTGGSDWIYCSSSIWYSFNIYYSYFLEWCSYCIWCIWLKNKSYCILNKEYTKEQWEKLSVKIFESMEQKWTLWEFFPAKLNPFYFNDTVAGLIWWFKKEEITKEWFMWRDEEIKIDIPDESLIISISELSNYEWFDKNWNWKINPEILEKVIKIESWDYYRIVKMEYDFLVKYWLPLPRLHWLERMKVNFGV